MDTLNMGFFLVVILLSSLLSWLIATQGRRAQQRIQWLSRRYQVPLCIAEAISEIEALDHVK